MASLLDQNVWKKELRLYLILLKTQIIQLILIQIELRIGR